MGLGDTNNVKSVTDIIGQMTERQRAATEAVFKHDYVLYGGARGGGKSWWLRWLGVVLLLHWHFNRGMKNVRIGLFCDTYPDLVDRQVSKIEVEFPKWLGELRESQAHGLAFHLPESYGGGIIALRNLDKPGKYKSAEFAAILVDQLEENTQDKFDILRGSKRWPGIDHPKFVASANPGGVGHGWVKRLWLDRDFPPELRNPVDFSPQFVFVPALPTDNPHLSRNYWDELRSLPPDLARAWVDGDWNVFEGQAFGQFRPHEHIIKPFDVPRWWPRWRAIDWGYSAPFCCMWLTKNPDNSRVFAYRELYESGLTDRQQARAIREYTQRDEQIRTTFADPSMWSSKTQGFSVTSTADEYAAEGVPLTRADNDRLSGKRKIDRALGMLPDGKPGLLIFETCTNLIRTLPALPYDKRNVEDVDTNAEDHAYDALRYGFSDQASAAAAVLAREAELPEGYVDGLRLINKRL